MQNSQDIVTECERLDSQGLYRDAVQRLSEAIASTPNDQLFHERGDRYERLGEYHKACEDFSTAVSLAPKNIRYRLSRGRLFCSRLGRVTEAVDDFTEAISANPNSPVPYQHLSICYLLLGDVDMACQHAERAIELDTANAFSYYCLGKCRLTEESYHSAAKQFEIALQFDSHSSLYWNALGGAFLGTGDTEKAKECYRKGIRMQPSAQSYIHLARIQLDTGDPHGAIESLNSASEFDLGEVEKTLVDGFLKVAEQGC